MDVSARFKSYSGIISNCHTRICDRVQRQHPYRNISTRGCCIAHILARSITYIRIESCNSSRIKPDAQASILGVIQYHLTLRVVVILATEPKAMSLLCLNEGASPDALVYG